MKLRAPIVHEILALFLLGAAVIWGASVIYSQDTIRAGEPVPTLTGDGTPLPTAPRPNMLASILDVDQKDPVQRRILADYGSMFVARNGAVPPPSLVFASAREVDEWQATVPKRSERIARFDVELQEPAMDALLAARGEARTKKLDITPRGADAARRSYADTVRLWTSRVEPALDHWVAKRRLPATEAARIRRLSPVDQISEVLGLEAQGIFFSTDFSKSILYSVAAPGTSQHLSMLALDVAEFENPSVRTILSRHGWFQTVASDLPHFTYLGVDESELTSLGLKRVVSSGRPFWVPDLDHKK